LPGKIWGRQTTALQDCSESIDHVYSAVLVSWEERNGLIESIFTGYKFVPKAELEEDSATSKAD